ncbi:NAD-dependent epimerase/dehydratase family protein [Planctomycetota bacterium]
MSVALITGSSGLVGSEAARLFHDRGLDVVGIDNDMRKVFFGPEASVSWNTDRLTRSLPRYSHHATDIRRREDILSLFGEYRSAISVVLHAAAQPSHDWARSDPHTDFTINANGTLNLLEATRRFAPEACFLFTSTNKVYGDTPNRLPFVERELRWEIEPSHPYAEFGVDESMSIDHSLHSLFGASKVAADVLCQEYARTFGLKVGVFRCGCVTGASHSGAELHGFLSYLAKCAMTGKEYTIIGYEGKQVRDNIHARDLASVVWHFFESPRAGAVYNIGGGRHSNCSVLEAIGAIEERCGSPLRVAYREAARDGDHRWWISDMRAFRRDFPGWDYTYDLSAIVDELVEASRQRAAAS